MAFVADLFYFAVGTLVSSFFLHLAASFALGGTPYWRALLVAVLGNVAGALLLALFPGYPVVGFLMVLVAWLAIAATVYRTSVWKALFIGLFAYLLWVLTRNLVQSIIEAVR